MKNKAENMKERMITGLILASVLIIGVFSQVRAQGVSHHFECAKPKTVIMGEVATFVFTAHQADGAKIADANNKLIVYLTSGNETRKFDVNFRKGEGVLKVTFAGQGYVILRAEDKKNADLTLSDMLKVEPVVINPAKEGDK